MIDGAMPLPPLNVLAVEPTYPGKLGALASDLARLRGCRVAFLHHRLDPGVEPPPPNVTLLRHAVGGAAREPSVAWDRHLERGYCYAYAAFEFLRDHPVRPVDLILGHSAHLGSTLFLATLEPGVPILQRVDPYLHPSENDLADDDAQTLGIDYALWRRSANAMSLLDLENGVIPWAASAWTRDTYPPEYRASIAVHPESVDHRRFRRAGPRPRNIASRALDPATRLVAFAARSADRLRGVDHFVALAERLIATRPDVVCALVGEPVVTRSLDVRDHGISTLDRLLASSPLQNEDRLWRLGRVDSATLRDLLQRADLYVAPGRHAEPTRVLGQAMAAGCVVLGWDIAPMREWIVPGFNGLLAPERDLDALTAAALAVLDDPAAHDPIARAAATWIAIEREPAAGLEALIRPALLASLAARHS
jgi:glycosyltransferase involved in cell wall biosynthesis